jgi:radical SAM protein with 4Fe4S-binding SPASM domain
MNTLLLRDEHDGCGYLFDRVTGKVVHLQPGDAKSYAARKDVDFRPLCENTPRCARAVPFCVWFELTLRCNLACIHCSVDATLRKDFSELNLAQVTSLLNQFADFGIFEVRYSGGEPTYHPEFSEIVRASHDQGLYVSVSTNGLWEESQRRDYASLPVGLYIVSLDGTRPDHNKLRPPGNSYDNIVNSIECLVDEGKRVRISTVLCKQNKGNLREHIMRLKQLGVEGITLVPVRPSGRAGTATMFDKLCLSVEEYEAVLEEVQLLRNELDFEIATSYDLLAKGKMFNTPEYFSKRCVAGTEAACVGPTGQLRSCILLDQEEYVVGDLLSSKSAFSDLWADDEKWGVFRNGSSAPNCCKECEHLGHDCFGICHVFRQSDLSPDLPFCPILDNEEQK